MNSYWCCIDYFKLRIFIVWDNSILLKKHHLIDFLWTFPLRSLPLLDLLLAPLGFLKLSCFRPFFTEPGNKKIGLPIFRRRRWFLLFIDIAKWVFPFLEELICLIHVPKFAQYLVKESHHQSYTLVKLIFTGQYFEIDSFQLFFVFFSYVFLFHYHCKTFPSPSSGHCLAFPFWLRATRIFVWRRCSENCIISS